MIDLAFAFDKYPISVTYIRSSWQLELIYFLLYEELRKDYMACVRKVL